MRVLITNDDGVNAPGLTALIEALSPVAELLVVAPDRDRSASGLCITLHRPLRVDELPSRDGIRVYQCSGTPADCTAVAVYALCGPPADLLIAGINDGANLGEDVLYSGTVGAALEGAMLGLPAVAVSAVQPWDGSASSFAAAAMVARRIVDACASGLCIPRGLVLNVNVPPVPAERIAGTAVTRLGTRGYAADVRLERDADGRAHYWVYGEAQNPSPEPDTDIAAILGGKVSLSPLTYRLTAHEALPELAASPLANLLDQPDR